MEKTGSHGAGNPLHLTGWYYFHVRRGQLTVLDHVGIVLADTTAAEVEAARRAHLASLNRAHASQRGRIVVANDSWQTLFELPF